MPRRKQAATRDITCHGWTGYLDLPTEGKGGFGRKIVICAKSDMGKSTLQYWLCYVNHKLFYFPIGMSNVAESVKDMERAFPFSCVYDRFDEASLTHFFETVSALRKDPNWHVPNFLIMLDDISDGKRSGALYTKVIRDCFIKGRHLNATLSLAIQNAVQLDKELRQNIDLMIMGKEANTSIRQQMFREFFSEHFDNDFNHFCDAANVLTSNYRWMVYNSTKAKKCVKYFDEKLGRVVPTAEQCIYIIRAKPAHEVKPFRLGHRDIWLLNHVYGIREKRCSASNYIERLLGNAGGVEMKRDGGEALDGASTAKRRDMPEDAQAVTRVTVGRQSDAATNDEQEARDDEIRRRLKRHKRANGGGRSTVSRVERMSRIGHGVGKGPSTLPGVRVLPHAVGGGMGMDGGVAANFRL